MQSGARGGRALGCHLNSSPRTVLILTNSTRSIIQTSLQHTFDIDLLTYVCLLMTTVHVECNTTSTLHDY